MAPAIATPGVARVAGVCGDDERASDVAAEACQHPERVERVHTGQPRHRQTVVTFGQQAGDERPGSLTAATHRQRARQYRDTQRVLASVCRVYSQERPPGPVRRRTATFWSPSHTASWFTRGINGLQTDGWSRQPTMRRCRRSEYRVPTGCW